MRLIIFLALLLSSFSCGNPATSHLPPGAIPASEVQNQRPQLQPRGASSRVAQPVPDTSNCEVKSASLDLNNYNYEIPDAADMILRALKLKYESRYPGILTEYSEVWNKFFTKEHVPLQVARVIDSYMVRQAESFSKMYDFNWIEVDSILQGINRVDGPVLTER